MPAHLEMQTGKFTFRVASDRFYNSAGVWAQETGDTVRIGLSDFVQQRSGDVAFADIRPEGTTLAVGDDIATIETIKVNVTVPSPVAGTILRINPLMETAPETINIDPYGEGWLCEIETVDWPADQKKMLDPAAYFDQMKQEAEKEEKND